MSRTLITVGPTGAETPETAKAVEPAVPSAEANGSFCVPPVFALRPAVASGLRATCALLNATGRGRHRALAVGCRRPPLAAREARHDGA